MSEAGEVNESYKAIIRVCCCCGAGLGQWHHPFCVYGLEGARTPVYEHQTRTLRGDEKVKRYRMRGEDDGGMSLVLEEEDPDAVGN